MNEAIKVVIHKVKRLLSRKYRREVALQRVRRRVYEWMKVAGYGKGYIPSHGFYVYEELQAVYKDLSTIL